MSNKTCGDCRHFDGRYNLCAVTSDFCTVEPDYSACDDFEQKPKPTNGDRIREMSNEELATWGMYDLGSCPTFEMKIDCKKRGECDASDVEACWIAWLNAPADDCVKKNGNHDTQTDLCKADDTESGVKDE